MARGRAPVRMPRGGLPGPNADLGYPSRRDSVKIGSQYEAKIPAQL
jgi:hypothetical protein